MSKQDDMISIKNLGDGILDTLNGIKNEDSNSENFSKNIEVINKPSNDVRGMDIELRKEVLNDLKQDITKKINKNKAEVLKRQLIKLDYEKKLNKSINTKDEQKIANKIIHKIKLQLKLSTTKLDKLQNKLTMVEQFLKEI